MTDIQRILESVKRIQSNLQNYVIKAVYDSQDDFQLLITSQLREGKSGSGSITPRYTPRYAEFKNRIGSISSPTPDLKLAGTFWDAIGIDDNSNLVFETGVENSNSADLGSILESRYGKEIYELNQQNLDKFFEIIIKKVNEQITRELNII